MIKALIRLAELAESKAQSVARDWRKQMLLDLAADLRQAAADIAAARKAAQE